MRRLIKWTITFVVVFTIGVVAYTNYYIATYHEQPVYQSDVNFSTDRHPSTVGSAVAPAYSFGDDGNYTPVPDGGTSYTDTGIDYNSGFEDSYLNGATP